MAYKETRSRFMRFLTIFLLLFLRTASDLYSQQYDTISKFSEPILLDSFTISSGFDVDAFIHRVRTDTTFYKAFRSMRLVPYNAVNSIDILNKKGDVKASWHSRSLQKIERGCRTTQIQSETVTGDFFDDQRHYNYYTAKLFGYLFFAETPVCNGNDIVAGALDRPGEGNMAKEEFQLKQLIFNPGARISGIPFMGDHESIFDPSEAKKYQFGISRDSFAHEPCFVFRITPQLGYRHKTLYDDLTTWFRESDYSIIARDYTLSYHTLLYDFDVKMKVRTAQIAGKLYPTHIAYDGNWHIITKGRERVKFSVDVVY